MKLSRLVILAAIALLAIAVSSPASDCPNCSKNAVPARTLVFTPDGCYWDDAPCVPADAPVVADPSHCFGTRKQRQSMKAAATIHPDEIPVFPGTPTRAEHQKWVAKQRAKDVKHQCDCGPACQCPGPDCRCVAQTAAPVVYQRVWARGYGWVLVPVQPVVVAPIVAPVVGPQQPVIVLPARRGPWFSLQIGR